MTNGSKIIALCLYALICSAYFQEWFAHTPVLHRTSYVVFVTASVVAFVLMLPNLNIVIFMGFLFYFIGQGYTHIVQPESAHQIARQFAMFGVGLSYLYCTFFGPDRWSKRRRSGHR